MDFSKVFKWKIGDKYVDTLSIDGTIYWKFKNDSTDDFYIENVSGEDNDILLAGYASEDLSTQPNVTLQYRIDDGFWEDWGSTHDALNDPNYPNLSYGLSKVLKPNQKMYLRGGEQVFGVQSTNNCNSFRTQGAINVGGDITSLIGRVKDLTNKDWCFALLFSRADVINADNLKLYPNKLSPYCYMGLFSDNSNLQSADFVLNANDVAEGAYWSFFQGCSSLTKAPEIACFNVLKSGLNYMFSGCSSLSEVRLPYIKQWNAENASDWLLNVAPTGDIKCSSTYVDINDFPIGSSGIPDGWTFNGVKPVVPEVPIVPFYVEDASGQANEVSINKSSEYDSPILNLEYSTDNSVWQEWVDCQSTTLPIEPNGRIYLRGTNNFLCSQFGYNYFQTKGTINIGGDITTLLKPNGNLLDLSGRNYTFNCIFQEINQNLLLDISKLILPSTTLSVGCYYSLFSFNRNITTIPVIKATTLATDSLYNLFENCTEITKIEVDTTTWKSDASNGWVGYLPPIGTFIKPAELQVGDVEGQIPIGVNGIPDGWTIVDK